jgi:SAM-dependent methyltransferase
MSPSGNKWNHNIHYHPLILSAVPAGCDRALDVGCGDGILARELRASVPHVTGIDLDEPSLRLAREHDPEGMIDFVAGDFLTYPFAEPFGFVASIACLHHMDMRRGLERMGSLLRPGGTLAIVGLARSQSAADLAVDIAGTVATRAYRLARGYWEVSAPTVWPPPETYRSTRRIAAEILPRATYRRHLLFRYSLVWTKPAS